MPSRILREGINSSSRILALSPGAEILYRRLMSVVDDYGCYHAAAQTVLAACWPTMPDKVCLQDVDRWLAECQQGDRPLLKIYLHDGAKYLQMNDFNQKVRTKSKFPQPADNLQADCQQNDGTMRNASIVMRNADATMAPTPSHTHGNASPIEVEDGWGAFVVAWQDAGLIGASGPDWQSALEHWRHRMDLVQRLASVGHLASVTAESSVAKMLPLGYLRSQAWTRTAAQPRPSPSPQRPSSTQDRMARILAKMEAEG